MEISWLREAFVNLQNEAKYIALENPDSARQIVSRIFAQVSQLADYPDAGRLGRIVGTRELVIVGTPYISAYRVRADAIDILRVFHSSRKWPKKL